MTANIVPIPAGLQVAASAEAKDAASTLVAPSNFLAQLGAGEFAALLAIATVQHYCKGDLVFRSGAPGNNVYFLRSGKIKIHQLSPLGREVILWFCFPGEIFGLAEVARGGGRVVNAQASERSEVLAVSEEKFRTFLGQHPGVAMLSMQVLSSRLRVLGEMFVNLVSDDVNTRVAKLILRLSARYGTRVGREVFLNIPLTHQEIADMVGTSRQTVTSALGAFKRQGVLSIDNRRIHIESEELLNELTQNS
ncbi:MAG: Crp/Fnr family transcriptional regulator [Betaproteobacteria bacterium]|nr:Crp/Fnr family transcriptional regulator [Betaproteobacteria bacterium]